MPICLFAFQPKNSFVQSTPRNKTELAIAQLVDMDMLQNWDEKITLEHLVQSKFKNAPTLNGSSSLRDDSIKDIKIELEQVKKQLNEISLYMRDTKSVHISEQQPRTTVSISRRPSMRDREYSATEHISKPTKLLYLKRLQLLSRVQRLSEQR